MNVDDIKLFAKNEKVRGIHKKGNKNTTSGSTLRRYLFRVKPPTEFNMIKNSVYSNPCSCGKIYKGETGHPLKVRLEEHRKAVVRSEIEKSGMVDHIWKEKLPLWDKVALMG